MKMGSGCTRILFLAVLAVMLFGCGGDDDDGGGGGGKDGGSITISQSTQPDFMDPALSYLLAGWEPMWLVYKGLIAYPHKEGGAGAQLVPGLAEDLPTISEDGKT